MRKHSRISDAILSGSTADIYFSRTQDVLRAEGLDAVVTMEVFPNAGGILCGVKEVHGLLAQVLPDQAEVMSLPEGESMSAKEVVLRITSPYSTFGLYETAMLGMMAQTSGWAAAARACVDAAAGIPVISFGARHVHPNVAGRLEYAAIVGGCAGCATPAGAELAGIEASGTIPHAMVIMFGDTVKATLAFDRHMPSEVRRVALVDTFHDECEESLRVAEALGPRLWGVRLDTPVERGRVTPDLVKELRARLDQAGHSWVRIVVSGGLDVERIHVFREQKAPVDAFGVGSAISGAPPIDFTGDLKVVSGNPIAKRGRIPGITNNPRLQRVDVAGVKMAAER